MEVDYKLCLANQCKCSHMVPDMLGMACRLHRKKLLARISTRFQHAVCSLKVWLQAVPHAAGKYGMATVSCDSLAEHICATGCQLTLGWHATPLTMRSQPALQCRLHIPSILPVASARHSPYSFTG